MATHQVGILPISADELTINSLRDILPELVPDLFPYADSKHWIEKAEYQMPEVVVLRRQIAEIEAEANERVRNLELEIDRTKERTRYLSQLLTETGERLVQAVKKTLEQLGFSGVVDADELLKSENSREGKREDLRLVHGSQTLLIEVKGITGLPTDADALQVSKYVVVRMREWKHTNVRGLEIINHQKGIAPLGREHERTFRDDIIVNAEELQFGLMTTWDLYRLSRSYLKLGWDSDTIRALFLMAGRIHPIPLHYEFVGTVEHFWEKVGAVGIRLEVGRVAKGDRIAFELPIEFEEQLIDSLEVENQQVPAAEAPSLIGMRTTLNRDQLKRGTRVFRSGS